MGGGGGGESTGGGGKRRGLKKTKVEIIPMIDTMFFLLVFFILSSVGVIKLQGINVDLPNASGAPSSAPRVKTPELIVAIDKNQQVSVNTIKMRPGEEIGPTLLRFIEKDFGKGYDPDKASVIISADPKAPHGIVVRCIDEARAVKIHRFAIATEPEAIPASSTP